MDQDDRLAGAVVLVVDLDVGGVFPADGNCGHGTSFLCGYLCWFSPQGHARRTALRARCIPPGPDPWAGGVATGRWWRTRAAAEPQGLAPARPAPAAAASPCSACTPGPRTGTHPETTRGADRWHPERCRSRCPHPGQQQGRRLAFPRLLPGPADAALSGHLLLGVLDPADELIAGQKRDVHPGIARRRAGDQRLALLCGSTVHRPTGPLAPQITVPKPRHGEAPARLATPNMTRATMPHGRGGETAGQPRVSRRTEKSVPIAAPSGWL